MLSSWGRGGRGARYFVCGGGYTTNGTRKAGCMPVSDSVGRFSFPCQRRGDHAAARAGGYHSSSDVVPSIIALCDACL